MYYSTLLQNNRITDNESLQNPGAPELTKNRCFEVSYYTLTERDLYSL